MSASGRRPSAQASRRHGAGVAPAARRAAEDLAATVARAAAQGAARRAAHARVGAGHVAVRGHDVRGVPLRAEPQQRRRRPRAGILWVTLLFAAMLGVNRLFVADADQGGFDGVPARAGRSQRAARSPRRSRCSPTCSCSSSSRCPPSRCCCSAPRSARRSRTCSRVLALGDIGIAAIGTLVAALAVRTRARDLLGPLLALPLLVPVVIGAARALAAVRAHATPAAPRRAGC